LAIGILISFSGWGEETCFLRVLEHVRERPSALPEGDSSVVWALWPGEFGLGKRIYFYFVLFAAHFFSFVLSTAGALCD
jgi:hypothetical protein